MSEETTTTANAGDSPTPTETPASTFSQEDVDRIVNDRLARERKKYEGFDDLKAKAEQFETAASERDALAQKVAEFEAKEQRAALAAEISEATGVPAAALRGDTREELEAHAAQLKSLLPTTAPAIPGAAQKPSSPAPVDPARDTVRKLFGTS